MQTILLQLDILVAVGLVVSIVLQQSSVRIHKAKQTTPIGTSHVDSQVDKQVVKGKLFRFASNMEETIGHVGTHEEYDRSSVDVDRDSAELVDQITWIMSQLPTDMDEELEEDDKEFFKQRVLGVYSEESFGSKEWRQANEPFFNDCVHSYCQRDNTLRDAAELKINTVLKEIKACMPNVNMDRMLSLHEQLTLVTQYHQARQAQVRG